MQLNLVTHPTAARCEHVHTLKRLRQQFVDFGFPAIGRLRRPVDRAMAKAHIETVIEALDFAIGENDE
jgi:hypothetical protein